jgi:dihydropteroate synthase
MITKQKKRSSLKIRNKELCFGTRTFLMGIVNVSPDSFSGDGCQSTQEAVDLALQHINNGADIIDIGGQSTRPAGFTGLPGYIPISEQDELDRVIPVITELRKSSDVIISVDSFVPAVLQKSLEAGADISNSIWVRPDLLEVAGKNCCPVILMHNKDTVEYNNGVIEEVKQYLLHSVSIASQAGVAEDCIILDPGIGFGKTPQQSVELLSALHEITGLGFPSLLGTSRKSVIGKLTDKEPKQRTYGTAATIALAISAGVDIIRMHDVAAMSDCIKVADAIVRNWRPSDW